jgi:tripartite ATP-independent transporter DctP family solute receptor
MRKLTTSLAALAMLTATAGIASAQQFNLKIGSVIDAQHPLLTGARKMVEIVESESKGRIKITLYPSSQLGAQREVLQNMQAGLVDGVIEATTSLTPFVPQFAALDLPYLVKDEDAAFRLFDSDVVDKELRQRGIAVGIHYVHSWEVTFRDIYTRTKAINSIGDLKGLKVRVIPSPSFIALFREFGAAPTPMAFGEIYTALQQGVIDGAENDDVTFMTSKHMEVAKNLALTRHMMLADSLFMSEKTWQKLPEDLRKLIQKGSLEARHVVHVERAEKEKTALAQIKAAGINITQPDLTPFIAAGKRTYAELEKTLGHDLVEKITKAAQ